MSIPETSEYQSREAMLLRRSLPRFVAWLETSGVLIQSDASNVHEVLRYRASPIKPPVDAQVSKADLPGTQATATAGDTGKRPRKAAKPPKAKSVSSVIYRRKDGTLTWMGDALTHWNMFVAGMTMPEQPEIAVPKKQRSWTERTREAIIERDGTDCWFCGKTMVGRDHEGRDLGYKPNGDIRNDMTIEHLIGQHFARTEGLEVNHMENLVLAHALCNRNIGHRPMSEKMTYREIMHDQRTTMWDHPEIPTPRERKRA